METFYTLEERHISDHIIDFLCSYDNVNYSQIISYADFEPQSFVVKEKEVNAPLIFFNDISYNQWILDMVKDQVCKTNYSLREQEKLCEKVIENLKSLLEYNYNGSMVIEQIYNQEFIDVIRRVLSYTIYGDSEKLLHSAKEFNDLADKIMPIVIDSLKDNNASIEDIFLYSVASGLSGLDLKGAPAAASTYANQGIPMKQYLAMNPAKAAKDYFKRLKSIVEEVDTPVYYWSDFIKDIKTKKRLVWLTDDYIETYFDLFFILKILNENTELTVEIIPKNGVYGNDMSVQDIKKLLDGYYSNTLKRYYDNGRLTINCYGPRMGAANIKKMSANCTESIEKSDILLLKGCRIHEMLQGGLNVTSYSAFIVSRSLSEMTTGFDSKKFPIILCRLSPKEYAFWGIHPKNSKNVVLNGRSLTMCMSTLADHERRKRLSEPKEIIEEFIALKNAIITMEGNTPPQIYQELDMLADKLVGITKTTYDNMCMEYTNLRFGELDAMDKPLWEVLESYIKHYVNIIPQDVKILDVATGTGRDIIYAISRGYQIMGVDNSDGFIQILDRLKNDGKIPENSYKKNDMRNLDFDNDSFDVVRHNASLLHLPIISKGYSADLTISEANRVLKQGGLLYVLVKKGDDLQFVDTAEGLGGRIFQFYSHKSINELLERNGFTIVFTRDEFEKRPAGEVEWISVIAQKIVELTKIRLC